MPEESSPRVAEAARGGFSVEYRGRALYSRVAPREGPERTVRELEPHPDTLYVVPSPLLGYGIPALLDRIPASSAVLALEADPMLAALSRTGIPPTVLDHPRFLFLPDPARAGPSIHALGRFRRAVEVRLSGGRSLCPDAYDEALGAVDAELNRYWRNRMTMVRMGRLWARNIVRNLASLPDSGIREPAAWGGPIAVCGAGPSLDAACEWLTRERPRLRILACDTAIGPLVLRGILPDAVVCLEGQIHNLKDFLPAGFAGLPVFTDLSSHPSVLHAVRGPKILTLTRYEELGFLDRLEALPLPLLRVQPLGSVGVLAVHLARRLTDGPVFLAGLDFSFPPGSTHARGAPAILAEACREARLYKARGQWSAAWPFEPAGAGTGGGAASVMAAYATLLAREVRQDPGIFDIRGGGLALGRTRLSFPQASRVLDAGQSAARPGPVPAGREVPRDALRSAATAFLEGETDRLEALLAALRGEGDLAARAADCDWIYSWFPDEHRVPALAGDVRNRLLAEALDWRRRLRDARAALEEP